MYRWHLCLHADAELPLPHHLLGASAALPYQLLPSLPAVWGNGDREAAVADWRRQLAAAHPETAAAVAVTPPVA